MVSWADEVEKEEEEAQLQNQEKQKLNPFGSATRPREVILQERGINWINTHQAPITLRKEKPLKENIPTTSQTFDSKLKKPLSRSSPKLSRSSPKGNLGNSEMASYQCKDLQGSHTYNGVFVPPVRYPPKNLIPYLFPPIQPVPSNLRMGQFGSFSITDQRRRDDHFKSSRNQHKVELEHDVKITNKLRNTYRY